MKAVVTGASRGFGRAISSTLVSAGWDVVGVARTPEPLLALDCELGEHFSAVVGDATDADLAAQLLSQHRPDLLVLNAGAIPIMAPIHEQSWESFSTSWQADTRQAFEWLGAALRLPLSPGSAVVVISSGAALRGSPLSGGYAGAKATVRLITSYAAGESDLAGLGLRFVTLFPMLTPLTAVGASGAAAYAARQGVPVEVYAQGFAPLLTADQVGDAVLAAALGTDAGHQELLLAGSGARPLPT